MERTKGTVNTNGDASCVYVYPLVINDLVTNMSLDQRAKWVSDLSGIPVERVIGLLKTPIDPA